MASLDESEKSAMPGAVPWISPCRTCTITMNTRNGALRMSVHCCALDTEYTGGAVILKTVRPLVVQP